ncbi:MAG: glycogen synthase [Promicromonosporaceae bacterium]|nr:glycogen synthase [Promicromonosporaceae bacterium]
MTETTSPDRRLKVDLLTREYPPFIYGGAGVHVSELAAVLRPLADVKVLAFDGPRGPEAAAEGVYGFDTPGGLGGANAALQTLGVDLEMANECEGADLVHSHTWYANMAGHWAKLLWGMPHVISAHSLEPMRPWKAEQLGGGYRVSSWAEKTAYDAADGIIAVSAGMRDDILRSYPELDPAKIYVVHNGIDLSGWVRPTPGSPEAAAADATVRRLGIDPTKPAAVFVGRITRQKGLPYLLRAAEQLPKDVQLVLCAGAPDTPEIMQECRDLVAKLREERRAAGTVFTDANAGVIWIEEMLPRPELIAVLSACQVFLCPSVYEPLGIVNLEAMAVGLPVVATATGGIPEVVDNGVTGVLVPIEQVKDGTGTPIDPDKFVNDLAAAINSVLADPAKAKAMGDAGRKRAEDHFAWSAIAERTMDVYRKVLAKVAAQGLAK